MHALTTQMIRTAFCIPTPFARPAALPMAAVSLDRLPGNEILMRQERMANMLVVRRERVTQSARALHVAGLIQRITVLDRPRLEQRAWPNETPHSSPRSIRWILRVVFLLTNDLQSDLDRKRLSGFRP